MVYDRLREATVPSKTKGKAKKIEGSIRASVSFDQDEYDGLKQIAESNRVSIAWVVREAVSKYLSDPVPLPGRKGLGVEP
jgi:predicted DNA-binding ribbon-helix-helix protein